MRKIIGLIILLFAGIHGGFGQLLTSTVDERFELTSIVCRLAGADEYTKCRIPKYADAIDTYFAPVSDHPLIAFMKEIRPRYGISYNAISSLAYMLEIQKGKIRLQKGFDMQGMQDTTELITIDPRWTKATLIRYLTLLNDFYHKSRFRQFFDEHRSLYASVSAHTDKLLQEVNVQWFENLFGQPFGTPDIYVSLTNGPSNYALFDALDDSRYGILIGGTDDRNFDPIILNSILHELSHRFCNPLALAYRTQMEPATKYIVPHIEKQLAEGGYGPGYFAPEWLTRLAVLMYLKDHLPERMKLAMTRDYRVGFIWQQRAVDFMEYFYADRERYEYLGDFMPQLVAFLDFTAQEIEKVVAEFENRRPYVVGVYPARITEIEMSQEVIEFRIKFSSPMGTSEGYRLLGGKLDALRTVDLPAGWIPSGWEDPFTYVLRLKPEWLEVADIHGFLLIKEFMQSEKGFSMANDFEFKLYL